jgi:putative radical SAM enzyme (TIGR03279 family)
MTGNPRASDIMKDLRFFADRKIRMHTQIVLCPGHNDGRELQNTISDLYKFFPYISSIAVVPVGLTVHRKTRISPVTKEDAEKTIEIVEAFQKRFRKKHGDSIVYCADEMYIKADRPFPPLKDYDAMPQIENGVGLVPLFLNQSKKIRMKKSISGAARFLTFTGTSFYPFLNRFIERLSDKENIKIDVMPVENNFFGPSVTVAGLLTGRDVIKALHGNTDPYSALLVPDVMLKEDEDLFLDNVSLKDIEDATGLTVVRTEASPQGLIDTLYKITEKEIN